jgi:hypothetical protein
MHMNAKSAVTDSTWVDQDDAQELTEAWFEHTDLRKGTKLLRRGSLVSSAPKTSTYCPANSQRWDAVLEADINNGKLNSLATEALAHYRAGQCKPL